MNADKTPTPRTDNEDHWRVDVDETGLTYTDAVRGDFARELERENAALRAALRELVAASDAKVPDDVEDDAEIYRIHRLQRTRYDDAWTAARALVEPQ